MFLLSLRTHGWDECVVIFLAGGCVCLEQEKIWLKFGITVRTRVLSFRNTCICFCHWEEL